MFKNWSAKVFLSSLLCLCCLFFLFPSNLPAKQTSNKGQWWNVIPEPENPSSQYDSLLYSEIPPRLREIELNSNRVNVEVIGQSAGGRNLFLVTLSAPEAMGRLGKYKAIRQTMLKDPERAQEMIDTLGDFKVPVFINASIHGNEYPGVDAAMRLIETLAYGDSEEVMEILENVILLVNVVQNPDGRVWGTRSNANGFDVGRDFITQSQPETQATVKIFTEWNPMVVLDLHGFVNPMFIEPCTPPHNPNYEYDLYLKWAFYQAEAMESELFAQTGFPSQIPFRDEPWGWDDWAPAYTAMYGMFHGSYGHSLETPYRDERGVDAHYWAMWGALKYVSQNRAAMIRDQIEIFRRGFLDLPQMLIPDSLLAETTYDQFNERTIKDFPAAYIIPADKPFQLSAHQPARLIEFLLCNDIEVEKTSQGFSFGGIDYPSGTYIVWMDQPKRGLANTFLEDGLDLSDFADMGLFFYSLPAAWSHPLLWGVSRVVMEEKVDIQTSPVSKATGPKGSVESGAATAYAFQPTSIAAFKAVNDLLKQGVTLYRATGAFEDSGRTFAPGTFIFPAGTTSATNLAKAFALEIVSLQSLPSQKSLMSKPRIALYKDADEGIAHALRVMGFEYDTVSRDDINAGTISAYDVFVNDFLRWSDLNTSEQTAMNAFFAAGGDYIGIKRRGVDFVNDSGILTVVYDYDYGNGIVKVSNTPNDSVAAGFREDDFAFVDTPLWFTSIAGLAASARFKNSGDFFLAGFWPDWDSSGAQGKPVIVHGTVSSSHVTLMGIDPYFRGHPENTFRLLGNALYAGNGG